MIGQNIRYRRELLDLSQEELARKMGYSGRSSIASIESGRVGVRVAKLKEFAKALECEVEDLMDEDDQKKYNQMKKSNNEVAEPVPAEGSASYYFRKTSEMAQELYDNEDLRLLFDAAKDCDPATLRAVHDLLLTMKKSEK